MFGLMFTNEAGDTIQYIVVERNGRFAIDARYSLIEQPTTFASTTFSDVLGLLATFICQIEAGGYVLQSFRVDPQGTVFS